MGKAGRCMTLKTIQLQKAGHTFRISYEPGCEQAVLDHLAEMVKGREFNFDWFDAAVLSHHLGQQISEDMKGLLPKGGEA